LLAGQKRSIAIGQSPGNSVGWASASMTAKGGAARIASRVRLVLARRTEEVQSQFVRLCHTWLCQELLARFLRYAHFCINIKIECDMQRQTRITNINTHTHTRTHTRTHTHAHTHTVAQAMHV
jgi:hypothetical protein